MLPRIHDVTDEDAIHNTIADIIARTGRIDILASNNGDEQAHCLPSRLP